MNESKLSRDRILGILAIVLGLAVSIYASTLHPLLEGLGEPGHKLFPMICGVGMVLCGIALVVRKPKGTPKQFVDKAGFIRMVELFVVLVLYVFVGLEYIGYLVSTFVLMTVLYMMLANKEERPKLWFSMLLSAVVTAILYIGFVKLVGVQMPKGVIFPALGLNF